MPAPFEPVPIVPPCVSEGRVITGDQVCCGTLIKVKTSSNPDVYMCVKPPTST